jgi:TRAP-type uncharacterized transport system fused permease subunit
MFCLTPEGMYLLMLTPDGKIPGDLAGWMSVLMVLATSSLAMVGLVIGATGYCVRAANPLERVLATVGGALLLMADIRYDLAGLALLAAAVAAHWFRVRRGPAAGAPAG